MFTQEGEELERIKARGWRAIFTSGLRESPEMLGRRLADFDNDCLLLYPVGYEIYPDLVIHGRNAMARNRELMIFSGHLEVLDANSARSDCLRAYAGEAPSHALLSSRIVPPACLIRTSLFRKLALDDRAGSFAFEVFVREAALGGEPIIVAPILAAALKSLYASQRETTKKLSAGLLDAAGIDAGLPGRLLSVDPVAPPGSGPDQPYVLEGEMLSAARRIAPTEIVREWEPVIWRGDLGGALVHPLAGHVTAAELRGPVRRIGRLVASVTNINLDNCGAEAAIALVPADMDEARIVQFLHSSADTYAIALSAWYYIGPGENARIEVATQGASRGLDRIIMLTRLAQAGAEANCHIVFRRVEAWYNENLL